MCYAVCSDRDDAVSLLPETSERHLSLTHLSRAASGALLFLSASSSYFNFITPSIFFDGIASSCLPAEIVLAPISDDEFIVLRGMITTDLHRQSAQQS